MRGKQALRAAGAVIAAAALIPTAIRVTPVAGAAAPGPVAATAAAPAGMWTAGTDGGVFGVAGRFFGSMGGRRLNAPVVSIAATPTGAGYWLASLDGGVFAFGDAHFFGSMGGRRLNAPVVGITATPSGRGYWLAAADGGVFSFGDARFFGSMGGRRLDQPMTGMVRTPNGRGYWMEARDGGVFTFGDAHFFGSAAGAPAPQAFAAMAASPSGGGYWLVRRDGHVAAFGHAGKFGDATLGASLGVGIVPTRSGRGYWIVSSDDTIRAFGDAAPLASPTRLAAPVVGFATPWASSSGYALLLLERLLQPRTVTWPGAHEVALTFDDGPGRDTAGVIAVLAQKGVQATFFAVGYEVAADPDLVRTEIAAGDAVGDHTWDHPDLTTLTPAQIDDQLRRGADAIRAATGEPVHLFRPPYGRTNATVISEATKLGMTQILWNVDPSDYLRPGSAAIAARTLAAATGRGIVVAMHDGGGDRSQTVAALPAIIDGLRARGYHFVQLR